MQRQRGRSGAGRGQRRALQWLAGGPACHHLAGAIGREARKRVGGLLQSRLWGRVPASLLLTEAGSFCPPEAGAPCGASSQASIVAMLNVVLCFRKQASSDLSHALPPAPQFLRTPLSRQDFYADLNCHIFLFCFIPPPPPFFFFVLMFALLFLLGLWPGLSSLPSCHEPALDKCRCTLGFPSWSSREV